MNRRWEKTRHSKVHAAWINNLFNANKSKNLDIRGISGAKDPGLVVSPALLMNNQPPGDLEALFEDWEIHQYL